VVSHTEIVTLELKQTAHNFVDGGNWLNKITVVQSGWQHQSLCIRFK
jgi:hypothetical protein